MLRSNTTVGRCRHLRYRFSASFFFQTQDVHLFSTTTTSTSIFPSRHEYYQPYKQAVKRLLLSTEFKSKRKSVLGQRLWTEDMFTSYEKWLLQKESAVPTRCKLLKKKWIEYLTHGGKDSTSIRKQTILELSSQSETLQSKIFATNHHQMNALLISKSVARIQTFVFNNLVRTCLEGGGGLPSVWLKIKESGTIIDTKQLNVLNNILDQSSTLVNSLELSSKEEEEILIYHDLLTGNISENKYTKQCVQSTFTHQCDNGDLESASSLLRVMKSSHISSFTLDHYMKVISMLIGNGQLRNAIGLKMFDEIITDMIGQVGSLSQSSVIHLYNILLKEAKNLDGLTSRLSEYPLDEVRHTIAKTNEILACRIMIDPLSSTCPVTKIQLYNNTITLEKRKQMFEDILALGDDLKKFSEWLDNRTDHPFTVILDAANIGSVERMTDTLMKAGEYPLVILSEKVATLNHERAALARRLKNRGILYTTPDGTDDDVYCMLATVSEQRASCLIHGAVSPVLVSNDRFSEHRKQMRLDRLWYKHYCFNQGRQKGSVIGRISELPSKVFKRRVTCSDWPVVDVKDKEYSSKALLIPVRGWRYQERLLLYYVPHQLINK